MKHRTILILSALIPILLLALLPIGATSTYNGISGALYCNTADGCLHEIGHKMDDDLGHPSRSAEFGDTVRMWLIVACQFGLDDIGKEILFQDGMFSYSSRFSMLGTERFSSPQEELYADLYALARGNMNNLPEPFWKFYSEDLRYTELYDCLMSAPLRLCGVSLHKEK